MVKEVRHFQLLLLEEDLLHSILQHWVGFTLGVDLAVKEVRHFRLLRKAQRRSLRVDLLARPERFTTPEVLLAKEQLGVAE